MKCSAGGGCWWGERAWHGAVQDYSAGRAQVRCGQRTQMQGYFGGFGQELQMVCDKQIPGTSLALNNTRTTPALGFLSCFLSITGVENQHSALFSFPWAVTPSPKAPHSSLHPWPCPAGRDRELWIPVLAHGSLWVPADTEPSSGSGRRGQQGQRGRE